MHSYRAITWDHPRGYNALAAAAAALGPAEQLSIAWERQPLEAFESQPIKDLCARYDLVVLDHPHVGEAARDACLRPLEDVFAPETIAGLNRLTIGPCLASYRYAGRHWALPLDAATQVMAMRSDLHEGPVPRTWAEVTALSKKSRDAVAMSIAGPHALLTFLSIAAAFDEPPAMRDPDLLVSTAIGTQAYELLADLTARSPRSVIDWNPIGILAYMTSHHDIALCPLIYGYVNYTSPGRGQPLRFFDAPRALPAGQPGSTLGGTGIGISARCDVSDPLKRHLLWLMGEEAQTRFIPAHDGQPSRRSAWADAALNERWGNFYCNTADSVEAAYVRPRHAGYIPFQNSASALLRTAMNDGVSAGPVLRELQALYRASHSGGGARQDMSYE
jgi:multiple sugar transport system substrate-binding protein